MKKVDIKKVGDTVSGLVQGTVDFGKRAIDGAKASVETMVEKSKSDSYARRLEKYNPLFPAQYASPDFFLPNVIVIVDDEVRRGIDVCEGAIGWRDKVSGSEVLYLYDEFVPESGLQFVPAAICDAVYCVDPYNRQRFIQSELLFSKAQEEKIAELKHIARCLGAKSCTIEITETESYARSKDMKTSSAVSTSLIKADIGAEQTRVATGTKLLSRRIVAEFEGSTCPIQPTLKWFMYDDIIIDLIDSRCNKGNTTKKEDLTLSGASSATISMKTAVNVDAVIAKVNNGKVSGRIEEQARKEQKIEFHFSVEF